MKRLLIVALLAILGATAWIVLSGGKAPSGQRRKFPPSIPDSALRAKTLKLVAASYGNDVAPLLERACFDCHSTKTDFPWYHHLPGVSQYLDKHVAEGKRRLDLSNGFPFAGRAPIVMRVRSIGRAVSRGSMPLWDYKLMHPKARLSETEKKVIVDWSENSFQELSRTARVYRIEN